MTTIALGLLIAGAAAAPLQPDPTSDEAWAETYTAVASLEDGSFVLLQLLFTNAGFGDGRGACRALFVPPGGAGINASADVGSGDWSYDAGSGQLLVGPCTLGSAGGETRFRTDLDGLSIDLKLAAPVSRVVPPDSRITAGGAFHESDLLVPWGRATAEITASGATKSLSGAAHLDHSRSNALLPKVADCWIRFRGFYGAPTLLQARVPPDGGAPTGWAWPLSEGAPTATDAITIGQTDAGQPRLQVGELVVEPSRQIYRYRPTEAYGAVGKLAAPWIGDPTTTTWRAATTDGAINGILEVSEIAAGGCSGQ